jgi:pyruvate dehydrogenase E2 component (dihydrolipoamide acetyltransferase)
VVVVESDKADMDVESFYEGYLAVILVEAGQEAPVGQAIALVAETEAEIEEAKKQGATAVATKPAVSTVSTVVEAAPVAVTAAVSSNNGRTVVSPRARKLAQEFKIDLKNIKGSGPYGRIVAEDVERAAGRVSQSVVTVAPTPVLTAPTPIAPVTPVTPVAQGETVALSTLQQAVVKNMMVSLQVPTFHVGYTITTDALDALYRKIKSKGVTMTALLAKAIANSLQKHPLLNATYTDAGIKYNQSINVAIAVAMPDGGLITPVLQNADKLDIYSLSRNWQGLVEKARAKQLQPQEYNTGTFTVSNLGMFGVDRFDAILPPGQGSILAIGASKPQVVANEHGLMGVKRQMAVNITCDHRIIYGADAASFLQDLAKLIETEPQSLTL